MTVCSSFIVYHFVCLDVHISACGCVVCDCLGVCECCLSVAVSYQLQSITFPKIISNVGKTANTACRCVAAEQVLTLQSSIVDEVVFISVACGGLKFLLTKRPFSG